MPWISFPTLAISLTLALCTILPPAHAEPALTVQERQEGLELIWRQALKSFPFRERLPAFKQKLEAAKADVLATEDTARYYARLQQLTATLNDGHTFVLAPRGAAYQRAKPSVGIERVGGVPVITWVRSDLIAATPLGSRVLSIDGRSVQSVVAEKLAQVSASTEHHRLDIATSMAFEGQSGSWVSIEYQTPSGETRTARYQRAEAWPDGTSLRLLEPWVSVRTDFRVYDEGRVAYFAARDFNDMTVYQAFAKHLQALQGAQALIVDIRQNSGGNSAVGYAMLSHLLTRPVLEGRSRAVPPESAAPESTAPDPIHTRLSELPRMTIEPKAEHIPGRLLVLTDHATISAAEDFLSLALLIGAVQVGQPTAGSTGEMVRTALPGGGRLLLVSKWDQAATGEEFVGSGFTPHIPAAPTPQSLVSGEDPILNAALRTAREWRTQPQHRADPAPAAHR
ncbi:S41 family peptidase [Roseateles sp. BYS180W]|uniref:S41 family peptidase n=1 Tax=Roseateles rivi TaxID=3299028 RepID=A0ABW7FSP1_9BURK